MSGEVNRLPQGLLSLLDMNARGQTPRVLSGEVQLGIDGLGLYTRTGRTITVGPVSSNIGAAGFHPRLTVPSREVWLAYNISILSGGVLAAGTTYRIAAAYEARDQFGSLRNSIIGELATFTAAEFPAWGISWESPLILGPGDSLGVFAATVTLGTQQAFNVTVDALRLTV